MTAEGYTSSALDAIRRAFEFARESGHVCGPADFLVGIAECGGAVAAALNPAGAGPVREAVGAAGPPEDSGGYLHLQVQEGARSLAAATGQAASAGHLLVALIDQARPEVMAALRLSGRDPAAVRRSALAELGLAAGLPPIQLPALTAAGTLDRPPLPVADLDPGLWTVLRWRQDHLPLRQLHGRPDARALERLESDAVWRLVGRLGLDDDQRFSAMHHHRDRVTRMIAQARPELADGTAAPRRSNGRPPPQARLAPMPRRGLPLRHRLGLDAWVSNRQSSARLRWLRLRTRRAYRDCPAP